MFQLDDNLYVTVAQAVAAIFAMGGIFAVYSYQRIDSQLQHDYQAVKNYMKNLIDHRNFIDRNVDSWLQKDIMSHLRLAIVGEWELNCKTKISLIYSFVDYYSNIHQQQKFKHYVSYLQYICSIPLVFLFSFSLMVIGKKVDMVELPIVMLTIVTFLIIIFFIDINIFGAKPIYMNNPDTNFINSERFSEVNVLSIVNEILIERGELEIAPMGKSSCKDLLRTIII